MKQFKLNALVFVTSTLFSSVSMANVVMKDEVVRSQHNWTGFYVGLNAGAAQHTMNMTDTQAVTFLSTLQQVSSPGLTGGLQAGYRRQMDLTPISGVYGAEFSANFSNISYSKVFGSPFSTYQLSAKNELNQVYLLQLLGGIAADRTLLFLAAGVSATSLSGTVTNQSGVPFFNSFNVDQTAFGTAFGGGVEYAYNEKISMRLKVDAILPNSYSTTDNVGNSYQISNNIVQATFGVNYQFS